MLLSPRLTIGRMAITVGLTIIMSTSISANSFQSNSRQSGVSLQTAKLADENIPVYVYQPKSCRSERLLILLPGFERKAEFYARRARRLAKMACLTVIAPEFDQERFPRRRYQRAGIREIQSGKDLNGCTGFLLRQLLTWSREFTGMADAPYYIFGHSAGAQLLSRVSAFCPMPSPERIVIANPSSHVAPNLIDRLPFGFGGIPDVRLREQLLQSYLAQPITIYLGELDVGSDNLDTSARAMRQGDTRIARGQNVYRDAKRYAELRGWQFNWLLVTAPEVGHSSKGMLQAPEVLDAFLLR